MLDFLEVQSLSKSYQGQTMAVAGINFKVAQRDILCLLGPSGCGKTTLLRLIAGLERPDGGDVRLAGQSILAVPPHRRDFGMMFQDFALFPHKNVFDNVAFGLQMRADAAPQIERRVSEMLSLVNLHGFERRDISQLSGGEQQRVALARSLAPGPQLLLLDEPLGALDRALRERLMLDLRTILKQVGVTAIYVTHDQTEAFAIADQVAVMHQGCLEQLAPPQTVFTQPASPFVAQFLGFHNIFAGTVQADGRIQTPLGDLMPPSRLSKSGSQSVKLLIKPEAASSIPLLQALKRQATIQAISFRGRYYQVWVEILGQRLMFEVLSGSDWPVGAQRDLWLDLNQVMVWPAEI